VLLEPLRLDSSLGNKEDLVLEFLLKFRNKSSVNLLDELKARNGDEDEDDVLSLLSLGNGFDFLGIGDVEVFKVVLKISAAIFNISESLSNCLVELSWIFLKGC
jgi:hypothetical protein